MHLVRTQIFQKTNIFYPLILYSLITFSAPEQFFLNPLIPGGNKKVTHT